jgi:hypothetical protein
MTPSTHLKILLAILLLASCSNEKPETLLADFKKELALPSDSFVVGQGRDTLLIGTKGCVVFFEKESFSFLDGTLVKGNVKISLKECLSLADMIREGLSTSSDGQILETRGMVNVQAFADGKALKLKEGKKFIVHFPRDSSEKNKQMALFYGQKDSSNINWNLDKASLLVPTVFLGTYGHEGFPLNDTTKSGFYFKGKDKVDFFDYFYNSFDYRKLKDTSGFLGKDYSANFIVTKTGKITQVKVIEEILDNSGQLVNTGKKVDPYFTEYIQNLPDFEPFYTWGSIVLDSKCTMFIHCGLYPPAYKKNEAYNELFNAKYSAFKNQNIQSMNEAELKYYVFSASNLGWINCDYFWQNKAERIDYLVQVDPNSKPDIKLIFKNANSIMAGNRVGNQYVFEKVPVNEPVKLVALQFTGSKPLLSVTEATTSAKPFSNFAYKEFTLAELEKQLNNK